MFAAAKSSQLGFKCFGLFCPCLKLSAGVPVVGINLRQPVLQSIEGILSGDALRKFLARERINSIIALFDIVVVFPKNVETYPRGHVK